MILLSVDSSFLVSALSGKGGGQEDVSPANMRNAINQLMQLGFSRDDCANALKQCKGLLVRWFGLGISLALKRRLGSIGCQGFFLSRSLL